jgi:hypothetical protein
MTASRPAIVRRSPRLYCVAFGFKIAVVGYPDSRTVFF